MGNEAIVHSNGVFAWATISKDGCDTEIELIGSRYTTEDGDDLVTELQELGFTVSKMTY